MPLDDNQLSTIREQRKSLNSLLERNRSSRLSSMQHAFSVANDFLIAILTISLGLGSAIVPLVLLGETISVENKLFLSIASFLLIANSIFITLILKKRTENLSLNASANGIEESLAALRLRNLLTKSILTKDEKYFAEYNSEGRKIADESVSLLANNTKWGNLDYTTDVASGILVIAALTAIKPIVGVSTERYTFSLIIVLILLTWWFTRDNEKYSAANKSMAGVNKAGIEEEKEFNKFVTSLIEKLKAR